MKRSGVKKQKYGGTVSVEVVRPSLFTENAGVACEHLWDGIFTDDATASAASNFTSIVEKIKGGLSLSKTKIIGYEFHEGEEPNATLQFSRLAVNGRPRSSFEATVGNRAITAMQIVEAGPSVGVFNATRDQETTEVTICDPFLSALENPQSASSRLLHPNAPLEPADQVLQAAIDLHYVLKDIVRIT